MYARDSLLSWEHNQWLCLDKLWTKESNWRHEAYNKQKVMGKNAGGIPQILGLSPNTNPTEQIDRGLDYISHRYGTPCKAWKFWQKNGWY
jgi:tRNA(Met) C34 N-acetyltransferase TmcA